MGKLYVCKVFDVMHQKIEEDRQTRGPHIRSEWIRTAFNYYLKRDTQDTGILERIVLQQQDLLKQQRRILEILVNENADKQRRTQ